VLPSLPSPCSFSGINQYLQPLAPPALRLDAAASNRSQLLKRRSSRIGLSTPVGLWRQGHQDAGSAISAKATNLNRHGAAIQLSRELSVGSTVVVRNVRGISATARVVAQVSAIEACRTYGIEFVDDDQKKVETFWGIAFPPKA
jgi:hypothetical protein